MRVPTLVFQATLVASLAMVVACLVYAVTHARATREYPGTWDEPDDGWGIGV
jgi:hypothetical protein